MTRRVFEFISHYRAELICALLLVVMGLNFLSVLPRKNLTLDETIHIPAGFYNLHGNLAINIEHPPLVKMLSALPLLFTHTQAAAVDPQREYSDYQIAQNFWRANDAHYEALTFWPRVPMIAIALLLGALIFFCARRLFGPRTALLAAALYALEPTVPAHGRVVQTDIASALAYLLLSFALYFYLQTPNFRYALYVGLSAGLALSTKFSMVALAPFAIVPLLGLFIFAPRLGQKRGLVAAQLAIATVALIMIVNAGYLFHHPKQRYTLSFYDSGGSATTHQPLPELAGQTFMAIQHIIPADFIHGMVRVVVLDQARSPAGLLGMYSKGGWWYYFPVAFGLKTTIPFLLLSVVSIVWALWILFRKRDERVLVLLVPVFSFAALAMMASTNIGIRHLLPVYPFLFILGGAFLDHLLSYRRQRVMMAGILAIVLAWMGIEAIRAYPDYLTYMNEFASRAPHWYYLSDSNVEWGDDVKGLAAYLHERGEDTVSEAIWGFEILEKYGIRKADAPSNPDEAMTRYVAVGASFLNGSVNPSRNPNDYAAYRELKPEKIIGGSIYVYRIRP